jgi:hypothetical protein
MENLKYIIGSGIFLIIMGSFNNSFAQTNLSPNISYSKTSYYNQWYYNPWTIQRKIATYGLIGSWGVTLVGSLAMNDDDIGTTIIPVVGPFVSITRIENDPNQFYRPGGRQLLMTSGIVQSAFLIYLVVSLIGESNYHGTHLSSNVTLAPTYAPKVFGLSMNLHF